MASVLTSALSSRASPALASPFLSTKKASLRSHTAFNGVSTFRNPTLPHLSPLRGSRSWSIVKAEVSSVPVLEKIENFAPSKIQETLNIEREAVINTIKPKILSTLGNTLGNKEESLKFLSIASKIDAIIQSWYFQDFEQTMEIYSLFEPIVGNSILNEQNFSEEELVGLEDKFMEMFYRIMGKSNYMILSKEEYEVAMSGQYILDFSISVDKKKLDSKLISRFVEKNSIENVPSFSNQFIIFRRGVGIEKTKNYFFIEKLDIILARIWRFILVKLNLKEKPSNVEKQEIVLRRNTKDESDVTDENLRIERIRLENMKFNLKSIFSQVTIQEPSFERITVLFRKASSNSNGFGYQKYGERGIHIMHFQNVPMADMEVVLPEKSNPGFAPFDLLKFFVTSIGGLTVFFNISDIELNGAFILVTIAIYLARIYFRWRTSLNKYENLINQSMYSKHLDNGKGTLLHLQYETIQQEVKEAIISFFVLKTQGPCTMKQLDLRCEKLLLESFNEIVDFEVDDALSKLEKLNLVSKDENGIYSLKNDKEVETALRMDDKNIPFSLNLQNVV